MFISTDELEKAFDKVRDYLAIWMKGGWHYKGITRGRLSHKAKVILRWEP